MTREEQVLADMNVPEDYVDRPRKYVNCAFMDGVNWADSHPQSPWRSVDEELPLTDDDVVVAYRERCGGMCMGVAAYFNCKWYSSDNTVIENKNNIKYWMPLPPLPETRKENNDENRTV